MSSKNTQMIVKGLEEDISFPEDDEMDKVTTIQITKATRKRLKDTMSKSDQYNEFINKLITFYLENKNIEGIIPLS